MKKKKVKKVFTLLAVFTLFFSLSHLGVTAGADEGEDVVLLTAQAEQAGEEAMPEPEVESALLQREQVAETAGGINLFNGKLRLKANATLFTIIRTHYTGFEDEFHNSKLGVFRTSAAIEALARFIERPDLVVNLQSYFKYWYEAAPDLDTALGSNMASWARYKNYQTPREDWDEWINELYLDIYKGPWNVRLGKQVVFWSEVEMVQTVDKVNPLDIRYTTPGIDPWDEMKIGLWMLRLLYNSNLPGHLIFEHIFIPGDVHYTKTPREGTWWGGVPQPNPAIGPSGMKQTLDDWWDGDKPSTSLKWYEFAFRVRGNSSLQLWDFLTFDWTVSYFNTLTDTPLLVDDFPMVNQTLGRVAARRGVGKQGSTPTVASPYAITASGEDFRHIPGTQWQPKRYEVVGGSVQFYEPITAGVWRGEVAYEIGRPYNCVPSNRQLKKWFGATYPDEDLEGRRMYLGPVIHRDTFNYGITVDRPTAWPWLQTKRIGKWQPSGIFELTLGYFQGVILGPDIERVRRQFGFGNKWETNYTLLCRTKFLGPFDIYPTLRCQYNTRNWGSVAPSVRLSITSNWSFESGFIWLYAHDPTVDSSASAEDVDFGYIRLKYEF